jgi:hypothetical protein
MGYEKNYPLPLEGLSREADQGVRVGVIWLGFKSEVFASLVD